MQVHLLGVRGSTPAPGTSFARYGGHTSCVAVGHDDEPPSLVLDAGTGIRTLSQRLGLAPFRGSILLSHLHLDHHLGLPFFASGDRDDARVTLHIPAQGDAEEALARALSPPHFPVRPSELHGDWSFESLEPGTHEIEGFEVLALDVPHKGGRTFGYRVTDGGSAIAYVPDHSPTNHGPGPSGFGELHEAAMALASGVDLLIHDAQYTAEEFGPRSDYGHCAMDYPLELGIAAGARCVILFHHDPSRTDDELDRRVAAMRGRGVDVEGAAEGTVYCLPAAVTRSS